MVIYLERYKLTFKEIFFFNLNLLETKDSKETSYSSKNSIGVKSGL